jgi:N-acetylmuramoyl-L-alanine amidase
MRRKSYRKRVVRIALLSSNVLVLGLILAFVLQPSRPTAGIVTPGLAVTSSNPSAVANPLDQLSSADIALTVAQVANLPETTPINNQADSQAADLAMASTDDSVVTKPQVVETALKSRADIQTYVTQTGDTVASIASKFGVTSNSILWSNNLTGSNVAPNQTLVIPPVNGIVYTVKASDTPASLATKFSANQAQIVAYNDAELAGLQAGEQIIIPNGTQTAAVTTSYAVSTGNSFPWGSGPIYGSNGYDYGYCTWYVASQIAIPSNWGNASSWAYYAALSGWTVSSTPKVGAIAQTPYAAGGEGHVAIVDAVSADGTKVEISDMNGIAGWGRVGTAWESTSTYPHYIYH